MTPHGCITASPEIRADGLSQSARLSAHISLKGVSFHVSYISLFRYVQSSSLLHIVVGMFLLPSTSPKLRTLTAYAASAMGAKLSFAFTLVTYKAVNPQFSTFLINTCRSCFAPIKSTLALPFRVSWVAISQDIVLPLLSVLMVEALGTAPKSSLPFVQHH